MSSERLRRGDDGLRRCPWAASTPDYLSYHDEEWSFRSAFAGFRIHEVASFGPRDVKRLMADAGIVRNRKKIEAAVANAQVAAALETPLAELAWGHRPRGRRPSSRSFEDLPSVTPESTALSRELKRRGFRFVGPTTAYALMQACGIVDDHVAGCWVRAEVERERRLAIRSEGL